MEDKENVIADTWNQVDSTLGKNFTSPEVVKSPTILNEITSALNASPLACATAVVSEPAEIKKQHISSTQTLSLKKPTKDKQLKTAAPNSSAHLSEKRVLGSYRGRIVPSKINSFRKISENEGRKNSLPDSTKFLVRTQVLSTSAGMRDAAVTVNTSKPAAFAKAVPVSQSKPVRNHEKQYVTVRTVNKGSSQKNPNKNWKPLQNTVPANGASSVPRIKKTVPHKTVTQTLTRPTSKTHCASKSTNNIKGVQAESAEVKRAQPTKWQALQGKKKLPAPLSDDTQCKRDSLLQTIKEPVKSFWTAMAEEDDQRLFSDSVNKTLAECLTLIEKGFPDDRVQSVLEKVIESVPDAKKFAKYWVCQMRLEQFRSVEKVLSIYEKAILAGAHPKDELRRALADVMKDPKSVHKSEKCVEKKNTEDPEKEVNLDEEKIEQPFSDVPLNKKMELNSEEMSVKEMEGCLKSEHESVAADSKHKIKEQKPHISKKEVHDGNSDEDEVLELQTPENFQVGSYLIKYNLSTTPYLESTKKKLQCEANDSAVKDLKFLTPVRRSRRIQEKVNKLPAMLIDHSPCVSSLEQLGELGNTGVGFLYRENSALHKVLVCKQEQKKVTQQND
uniref:Cytoskeleton associated protein 2 n=1 Tax=Salvator merianae TaxID=96440 RepID=A0A8D0BEI3_SALMN